jgi:xanthine dehydrogenase accessory factor
VNLFERMAELTDAGRPFAVATVVRTDGSTPQIVGAKLVVVEDDARGKAAGTLGGGCVEADAIDSGREVLTKGGRSLRAYELTEDLAWNTGLVCGGTMWILVERSDEALSIDGRPMLGSLDDGWNSYVDIATRGHKLDADCILAAVQTKARYIGLLGSRRKTVLIEKMLKEQGIADDRIAVIHSPVGLDLGGRTPAEIALSVLA